MRFYAHGRRTSLGGGPLFLLAYAIGALLWLFVVVIAVTLKWMVIAIIVMVQYMVERRKHAKRKLVPES